MCGGTCQDVHLLTKWQAKIDFSCTTQHYCFQKCRISNSILLQFLLVTYTHRGNVGFMVHWKTWVLTPHSFLVMVTILIGNLNLSYKRCAFVAISKEYFIYVLKIWTMYPKSSASQIIFFQTCICNKKGSKHLFWRVLVSADKRLLCLPHCFSSEIIILPIYSCLLSHDSLCFLWLGYLVCFLKSFSFF